MAGKTKQASPTDKGEGKRIRRARNIVKRWKAGNGHFKLYYFKRYERAVAVLVRAVLLDS
jgi:hypothetical protein